MPAFRTRVLYEALDVDQNNGVFEPVGFHTCKMLSSGNKLKAVSAPEFYTLSLSFFLKGQNYILVFVFFFSLSCWFFTSLSVFDLRELKALSASLSW